MSLRIRLRRVGRKKQPSYRLVVTDGAVRRDGPYVDDVGFYNPRTNPAELRLNIEKIETWIGKGATLSDTAASLLRKARKGGDKKVAFKVPSAEPEAAAPAVEAKPRRAPRRGSAGTGTPPVAAAVAEPDIPAAAETPAEEAKE